MKKYNRSEKGFTLVEMVIVISIIGVLAAIIIPSIINYVQKANRKADIVTARLIGSTVASLLLEDPEFYDNFYKGMDSKGSGVDYEVTISGESYVYRNVARADGSKNCLDDATQNRHGWRHGTGWEFTSNDPAYSYVTETLNDTLEEIIGGDADNMSFIPMRSTGYKHPASECNHDRGIGRSSRSRDKSNTYSYTDKWLVGYRVEKRGKNQKRGGQVEVWAGDSYGKAANGPRCRLWPAPPSYY